MPVPADTPLEAKERLALMDLMDAGEYTVAKRQVDENIIIATWNIRQFSENKSWRALKYIADIIERFDLVAIQEVKTDLRGLARLQEILPGRYRVLVTDATGNSERFAFLYDARTVEPTGLVSDVALDIDVTDHVGFQLHRMPYCASFRAGRFDFTIVSVHIFDTSPEFKEKEIALLADRVAAKARRPGTKVVDRDLFVVGDFNIRKEGDRFFRALVEKGEFEMPEVLNKLTTNFKRTGTYDKIAWVRRRRDISFAGRCNVVPFYKAVFQDQEPPGGYAQVSDHLPLWAEFRVNVLTQQLEQVINPGP
ncbi:MAG: endonuclease/exonuclease/phosphatase family protein [bacterium]